MATVASLGTGSGLELESLVTKLMAVEQQPLTRLQEKETAATTKLSSLAKLKSSLAALQTAAAALKPNVTQTAAEKFGTFSAASSTSTVATATTTSGVVTGSYSLNVTNVATAQQIRKSGISIPTGAGTLSIAVAGGTAVNVAIEAGSSLTNVVNEINDANAGVTASIITSGTTSTLVVTANTTGDGNEITLTGSGSGWEGSDLDYDSSDTSWTETTAANNAELTIDGIAVSSASNTLTNIRGLSVTLLTAGTTTLTVSQETSSKLTSAINAFVTAYNSSNTTMSEMGAYDIETKKAGELQGDSTLRIARTQTRALLFGVKTGGNSAYQTLSDLGVSVQDDGSLVVDSEKLSKAISTDYDAVATLIAKIGDAYDDSIEGIVGTDGSIASATTSLNSVVELLNDREDELQTRLDAIEKMYRARFTALDALVSSLKSTGDYLTQQFSSNSSDS